MREMVGHIEIAINNINDPDEYTQQCLEATLARYKENTNDG